MRKKDKASIHIYQNLNNTLTNNSAKKILKLEIVCKMKKPQLQRLGRSFEPQDQRKTERARKRIRRRSCSEPQRARFLQERDERAVDVGGHDAVHSSQEFSADEHGGNGLAAAYQSLQSLLHVFAVMLLVQLVHCRIDAEAAEEALDHMAHATRTHAEDHHCVLGGESLHPLQRRYRAGLAPRLHV